MRKPCLLWTGRIRENGYVQVKRGGKMVYIHRWVYEQEYGPIPDGHDVHHQCETRHCHEPTHLFALTIQDHKNVHSGRTCRHGDRSVYVSGKRRYCKDCRRENRSATHFTIKERPL